MDFISNEQIDEEKSEQRMWDEYEKEQGKAPLPMLLSHIQTCWQAAKIAKVEPQDELLKCRRQKKGEYDPEDLAVINQQGQPDIFKHLTSRKVRAVRAWIREVLLASGERPFKLDPTPKPELPLSVVQQIKQQVIMEIAMMLEMQGQQPTNEMIGQMTEQIEKEAMQRQLKLAKDTANKIENRIDDYFVEGNFYKALDEFVDDFCTYPTAFIHGPVIRKRKVLSWSVDPVGRATPLVEERFVREWERISPFDIYPSAGSKNLNDGYLFIHERLRPHDLASLIGVDGFDEGAIRGVLNEYGEGGLRDWTIYGDQSRAEAEGREHELDDPEASIDVLKFMGQIQGYTLLEYGVNREQIPDLDMCYEITAYMVGTWIIGLRLNEHPLGQRPYFKSSFVTSNDSIWGESIPQLMRDNQRMCNNASRSLAARMAFASKPMAAIEWDRLEPGENPENLFPGMVIKTNSDPSGRGTPPVIFFQPEIRGQEFIYIYDHEYQDSAETSGIENYMYGSTDVGGAGKTASGLSMMMNASSKTMRDSVKNIDDDVIVPLVEETFNHLMLYDPEVEKTGDIRVRARGSEYLIHAETLIVRTKEFLEMMNNPLDVTIVGIRERAVAIRELAKRLKLPVEELVPSDEQLEQILMQKQQEAMAMAEGGGSSENLTPAGKKQGVQSA